MPNTTLVLAALLAVAGPARLQAIELSLEENRAERGNIGFLDTQRVFKLFPETARARETFEEAVRQAEEQINLRKAEALRLRAELDALKVERESLAKAPPVIAAPPTPAPQPPAAPAQAKPTMPAQAAISQLPGFAGASTPTAAAQPLIVNLPGATTAPVVISPPAPAVPSAGASASSQTASSNAPQVAALDAKITQKALELERKESAAKDVQAAAEKNLLDLESRRSEILLGKIYKAVQEVSRREGISVVVDKSGILYGHSAVDLTDKVLKYLKGE